MTPEAIRKKEDTFFSTLKSTSGVVYSIKNTSDIGGATIYSIRPPYSTYYYPTRTVKKSICLHFTVGYIGTDVATLSKDNSHVSVSYTVDRCGRIYELFDDAYWSYHLGNAAVGGNGTMSKQSIGIEISNYGPLKRDGSNLIDAYKNVYCTTKDTGSYFMHDYRGYKYFATMTPEQIDAVVALVKHLSDKHGIPLTFKMDDNVFGSASEATSFRGIYCHTNVRPDKFDWPFCEQIQEIIRKCTSVPEAAPVHEADNDGTAQEPEGDVPGAVESAGQAKPETPAPEQGPSGPVPGPGVTRTDTPAAKPDKRTDTMTPPTAKSIILQVIELILKLFRR